MASAQTHDVGMGEISGKYKTVQHFYDAYTAAGKIMIDKQYISWHYIKDILIGQKFLINKNDIANLIVPPRYS